MKRPYEFRGSEALDDIVQFLVETDTPFSSACIELQLFLDRSNIDCWGEGAVRTVQCRLACDSNGRTAPDSRC